MIHFIIPLSIFSAHKAGINIVADKERTAINQGITIATEHACKEIKQRINRQLARTLLSISIKSAVIIGAVLFLPHFMSHRFATLGVSMIYLFAMLHGIYDTLKTWRGLKKIYKTHDFNIKKYLEHEIFQRVYADAYAQAKSKTNNLWHLIFGSLKPAEIATCIADESARNTRHIIFNYVIKKVSIWVLALAAYYTLARMMIIPQLLTEQSQLSFFATLFYPLTFLFQSY